VDIPPSSGNGANVYDVRRLLYHAMSCARRTALTDNPYRTVQIISEAGVGASVFLCLSPGGERV
jgi:hypothetical protein